MADSYFTLTVDDNSPAVAYAPFRDTLGAPDLSAGWNPYYTGTGFSSGSNSSGSAVSNIGNGTSLHLTTCDGAQVAIQWNGESSHQFSLTSSSYIPVPSVRASIICWPYRCLLCARSSDIRLLQGGEGAPITVTSRSIFDRGYRSNTVSSRSVARNDMLLSRKWW